MAQFLSCNIANDKSFREKLFLTISEKALEYVSTKGVVKNMPCKYWHCDILNTFQLHVKIMKVL